MISACSAVWVRLIRTRVRRKGYAHAHAHTHTLHSQHTFMQKKVKLGFPRPRGTRSLERQWIWNSFEEERRSASQPKRGSKIYHAAQRLPDHSSSRFIDSSINSRTHTEHARQRTSAYRRLARAGKRRGKCRGGQSERGRARRSTGASERASERA